MNYTCDLCPNQASQQSNVTLHKLSVHEGMNYSCEHCQYEAKYPRNLLRHILSVHEEVK